MICIRQVTLSERHCMQLILWCPEFTLTKACFEVLEDVLNDHNAEKDADCILQKFLVLYQTKEKD